MATLYSAPRRAALFKFAAGFWLLAAGIIFADESEWTASAAFARAEFQKAESRFRADATNTTNAWQFARTAFDYAEFSTNNTQRAGLARQGIGACRILIAIRPEVAAGHYYLAMNLGQLARTEFLGALRLVSEMEYEFETAAELDAQLDHAGPERNLGLLYREAPGWPVSIGSKHKSRPRLERAVQLAPDFPENHLNLIESYLKWGEPGPARKQLGALDTIWPAARTNLTGAKWEYGWLNWSQRRGTLRQQLNNQAPPPSKRN